MSDGSFDLAVVGLGAMGAAVAHRAAIRGIRVVGIDRHHPPHDLGSSHAETRITRLAVGEGPQYLPFVRRSHELWQELEAQTGQRLFHQTGGLIITGQTPTAGQRWEDFVSRTATIAADADVDFEILAPEELVERHPAFRGVAGLRIGYEPSGGLVMVEQAVAAQLELARAAGAELRTGELVGEVRPEGDGLVITTDRTTLRADRVVLAAGPWTADLDPDDRPRLRVTRQLVLWYEVDDLDRFRVGRFPYVIWVGDRDEDYLGVFPTPPTGTAALKVVGEQFLDETDPERVDRTVSQAEIDDFHNRIVAPKLAGVRARCVKAAVCLYTNTPDDHFLIDTRSDSDRILVMSPCSGHGFKHSAALGEAVAELVQTGSSTLDLSVFRRSRSFKSDLFRR